MKHLVLALALLVAFTPLATALDARPATPSVPADDAQADCGGLVCEVLCKVNQLLHRPCLRD